MREIKLTLPKLGNDGRELGAQHATVTRRLLAFFGGYTVTHGWGGWRSPTGAEFSEEVCVYTAAVEPSICDVDAHARTIAAEFKHTAKQEAVYYVDVFGNAYLI